MVTSISKVPNTHPASFETTATSADKAPYIKLLDDGMSAGTLAWLAADTTFNKININLVGLAQTGIEYLAAS